MVTECATCKYCKFDTDSHDYEPFICTLSGWHTETEFLCSKYEREVTDSEN